MALTVPALEAGTSAALATIVPSRSFSVETVGWPPEPHRLRKPSPAGGTTVAFSEYAPALAGMLHAHAMPRLTAAEGSFDHCPWINPRNYNTMTDTQAAGYSQVEAIFFQLDRRTGMMIELQLSSQLPLIEP